MEVVKVVLVEEALWGWGLQFCCAVYDYYVLFGEYCCIETHSAGTVLDPHLLVDNGRRSIGTKIAVTQVSPVSPLHQRHKRSAPTIAHSLQMITLQPDQWCLWLLLSLHS